ncbi:MAG: hypothetical protein WCO00_03990 [Rhodospirillaceae bacterium]
MSNNSNSEINGENSGEETADNVIDFIEEVESDDDGEAVRDIMQDDFEISICLKGGKVTKIDAESKNLIIRAMAAIANSSDLLDAQISIYGHQKGFGHLYRILDQINKLTEIIDEADNAVILSAFKALKSDVDSGMGFINIGRPKLPKPDDEFVAALKKEPFNVLLGFYFPNADAQLRSKYRVIMSWAKKNNRHNFVDWISNEIVYQADEGDVKCGKGISGALKFVRLIEKTNKATTASTEKPIDHAKKVGHNSKISIDIPGWLEGTTGNLMILACVNGDKVDLYDVTTSDQRVIDTAIKLRHAAYFANAFDDEVMSADQTIEMIKNVRKLIMPSEFLIWQDKYHMYMIPLYPTWKDDNGNIKRKTKNHYAIMLDIPDILEKDQDYEVTLPVVFGEGNDEYLPDVLKLGYSTKDIDPIGRYSGELNIEWSGNSQYSFKCLGALWETTAHRTWRPGKKDPVTGLERYLSEPPTGFEYIRLAAFDAAQFLSGNIDFDKPKKEFKKWKELQYANGFKKDTDVLIAIENGIIGIWFSPIKVENKKDSSAKVKYAYDGAFFEIGHTKSKIRGKWCVPEKRIERIWNFISHPWELYIPSNTDDLEIGEGGNITECLSVEDAEKYLKSVKTGPLAVDKLLNEWELRDKHYTRLPDLCSVREGSHKFIEDSGKIRRAQAHENGKYLCLPIILKCGRVWVHLPSEPDLPDFKG